jgi:hypothetical protein
LELADQVRAVQVAARLTGADEDVHSPSFEFRVWSFKFMARR